MPYMTMLEFQVLLRDRHHQVRNHLRGGERYVGIGLRATVEVRHVSIGDQGSVDHQVPMNP